MSLLHAVEVPRLPVSRLEPVIGASRSARLSRATDQVRQALAGRTTKRLHNQIHGSLSGAPLGAAEASHYAQILAANAVELAAADAFVFSRQTYVPSWIPLARPGSPAVDRPVLPGEPGTRRRHRAGHLGEAGRAGWRGAERDDDTERARDVAQR